MKDSEIPLKFKLYLGGNLQMSGLKIHQQKQKGEEDLERKVDEEDK